MSVLNELAAASKQRGSMTSVFNKLAADRATREARKALEAGDVDRVYRIAGGTSGSRPRLIKHLGSGADAEAFLIHGGGHTEPTVAKIVTDRYENPGIRNLLQESVDLKKVLGDRFADIHPLRGGHHYAEMTDRVGGLVQEWVPHNAGLGPAVTLRRIDPWNVPDNADVPSDIIAGNKKFRKLERSFWRAQALDEPTSKQEAARTAMQDARTLLDEKIQAARTHELSTNPAYLWSQEVRTSPAAVQNEIWDIADHSGNIRKARDGSFKLIDARLGRRSGGFVNGSLGDLPAPRIGSIKTRGGRLARRVVAQSWLPDLTISMGKADAPRLSKFQKAKYERALARAAATPPAPKPLPTPTPKPVTPAKTPTLPPAVPPTQQAGRRAGHKINRKVLGLAAGTLGLLGAGMAIHKIRSRSRRSRGQITKVAWQPLRARIAD